MTDTFVYADASALIKLFLEESETSALRRFLDRRPDVVSSSIARVEVQRALRRAHADEIAMFEARRYLTRVHLRRPTEAILDKAETLGPATLRTLDAIHLATALEFTPPPGCFLCYDERLAAAARLQGLTVVAPGVDEVHQP